LRLDVPKFRDLANLWSYKLIIFYRPYSTSSKTFASGTGRMRFKFRAHTCQRLATVATLIVWALAQSRGDGHRLIST